MPKGSGREGVPPEPDQRRRRPAWRGPRGALEKAAHGRRRGVALNDAGTRPLGLWLSILHSASTPTLQCDGQSLARTFSRTVRLLPGQSVRDVDLFLNAVRCLNRAAKWLHAAAGCLRSPRFGGRRGA